MSAPTMTPGEVLALLERDLPAGILAAADLREQRAKEAPWQSAEQFNHWHGHMFAPHVDDFVAAEANPKHSLAAACHWRGVVERHRLGSAYYESLGATVVTCKTCGAPEDEWPCPDLTEITDEVRAYLGGTS